MVLPRQSLAAFGPNLHSRRRQRRDIARTGAAPMIPRGSFLIVSLESGSMVFCCCSSEVWQSGCSVVFDTSILVEPSCSALEWSEYAQTFVALEALHHNESNNHQGRTLSQVKDTLPLPGIIVLQYMPIATLLSLVLILEQVEPPLEGDDSVESQPLLLSCLKSQLVGTFLFWEANRIDSVIQLQFMDHLYVLRTKSLLVSPQTSRQATMVYQILPNTKITFVSSPKISLKDISIPKVVPEIFLSPTAQYLVDTLTCLESAQFLSPASQLRFILLNGPPGTGKTYAVKSAVQAVPFCKLVALQGSQIMAVGHVGEAARDLQVSFQTAMGQNHPTLIFLDEFDALVTNESMETVLASLMDIIAQHHGGCVILVAATNRIDVIPPSLRRRFDHEIVMTPPRAEDRLKILRNLLDEALDVGETEFPSSSELMELARDCVGCVPSDLSAIVRKACLAHVQDPFTPLIDLLTSAALIVGASALRDAAINAPPRTTWDDIAGDAGGAKKALRQAIEWPRTRKAAFDALGLVPPKGILLYGPPGCAKTTLARAAAGAAGVAFISLDPADVYASSFVGDAEAIVRRAFSLARAASPCILFFDEIDAIIGSPTDDSMNMARGTSAEARVLSTFLNEMDGVDNSPVDGVMVLGATNRPWTLDAALLRPGRLDKIIYVPPPDREARRSLLKKQTMNWPMCVTDAQMEILVDLSDSLTGAEIVGCCRDAARAALRQSAAKSESFSIDLCLLKQCLLETHPLLKQGAPLEEFKRFQSTHKR